MDESLELDHLDEEASLRPSGEVLSNLDEVPGLRLDDMRCGDGFCRAVFSREDGEPAEILHLLGLPPFTVEVQVSPQPDGRSLVYFPTEGESLEELPGEGEEVPKIN